MRFQTATRLICAGIFSVIFTVFIGYYFVYLAYPQPKYYERLQGIYTINVLPFSLLGMTLGLIISERIIKRSGMATESERIKAIAHQRLKSQALNPAEVEAWGQILSNLKEDEP